ncbi:MAG: ion transporter [Rhodospirillaceae bacterium]|nr:ion transporter [Rhodospirillaceae bacterium]
MNKEQYNGIGEGKMDMPGTLRHQTHVILSSEPPRQPLTIAVTAIITAMIVINVVAVILASVSSLSVQFSIWFKMIELVSAVFFTAEWILRVWACVERSEYFGLRHLRARLRYILSPLPLIDIIAIAPLYLAIFDVVNAESLIALRLLRLLQLVRFFSPLVVLWRVIRSEAPAMMGAIFIVLVLMIIAASGMYLVERDVQPEDFGSIPAAMWWASVTLTTVGYGDVTPITVFGRMFGVMIMVLGIGLVALPAGMLASRFSEELHHRREEYRRRVDLALQDGRLDDAELDSLKAAQREYMLTDQTANQIVAEESKRRSHVCQTCGKTVIT